MRRWALVAAILALGVPLAGCSLDPTASDEYRALEARLAGVQAEREAIRAELYTAQTAEGPWGDGGSDRGGTEGITIAPLEWGILLDEGGAGVHTILMVVDVTATPADVAASGVLVWDEAEVELCGIGVRESGVDFVRVGDIFQTTEGCGNDPTAVQDAFDRFGVATKGCLAIGLDGSEVRYCAPLPPIELTPVEWDIALDRPAEGVHTIHMILQARPLTADQVEDLSARLVWEDVQVVLCGFDWDVGDGFLLVGDIFQTDERCPLGDVEMQDAIDERGLPETACVAVTVSGVVHEYCAPLTPSATP